MSESRKFPAEYGNVPESPDIREFVYWNLIEYFNIDMDSDPRPDGMMRGSRHTATIDELNAFLENRAVQHNEQHDPKIVMAKATLPKVLLELSLLRNTGAAYMYNRIAFFEAKLYEPKDPSMTEAELKAAGYKEEHADDVFRYSPTRQQPS